MAHQIAEIEPYLRLIVECSPRLRKAIINEGPIELLCLLTACAVNILSRTVPVTTTELNELKQHRALIYSFADKKHSANQKRAVLTDNPKALTAIVLVVLPVLRAYDHGLFRE